MVGRGKRGRLGQHFLVRLRAAGKLVAALEASPGDHVLEIGPGRGVLTRALIEAGARVLAVEIDPWLVERLKRDFADPIRDGSLKLVEGDILDFDIERWSTGMGGKVRVLGNLPYSQTRPIMEKLVDSRGAVSRAVVTVQAEVAGRMTAAPGGRDYGAFSVFIQYHASPRVVADLPARYFRPPPKVDSTAVRLDFYHRPPVRVDDEELFFTIVRKAFNQRRKTVRNALAAFLKSHNLITGTGGAIAAAGIDPELRPEALSIEDYARLSNHLADRMKQSRG